MGVAVSVCRRDPGALDVQLNLRPGVLFEAVEIGDLESVRQFLRLGIDICAENQFGQTPLHAACLFGRKQIAEFLLSQGAELEAVDKNMLSPFIYAAVEGHQELMEMLLERGANANSQGKGGLTPLHFAVRYSPVALEAAEALVECGADPCARSQSGERPLHSACFSFDGAKVVSFLLDLKAAVVNECTLTGTTPLHIASANAAKQSVTILLRRGADIEIRNKRGCTALHLAAGSLQSGRCQVVEELLLHSPDNGWIDTPDLRGRTPLHYAAADGQYSVVELLLAKGADVGAVDAGGRTILHAACAAHTQGRRMIVEDLLDRGLAADEVDAEGYSPLHLAAKAGNLGSVEELLRHAAQTSVAAGESRCTPLHLAARHGHTAVCEVLIKADGRLMEAADDVGRNALHWAAMRGHAEVATILMDSGMSPAAQDDTQQTPLHIAASAGDVDTITRLTEARHGMRHSCLNLLDGEGLGAIHIAAQQGWEEATGALMTAGCRADILTAYGKTAAGLAEEAGHGNVATLLRRGHAKAAVPALVETGSSSSVPRFPAENMSSSMASSHQSMLSFGGSAADGASGGTAVSTTDTSTTGVLQGPNVHRHRVHLPPVKITGNNGGRHTTAEVSSVSFGDILESRPCTHSEFGVSGAAQRNGAKVAGGVSGFDEALDATRSRSTTEGGAGVSSKQRSELVKDASNGRSGGARDKIMRALSFNNRSRQPTPAEVLKQLHAKTKGRRASLFPGRAVEMMEAAAVQAAVEGAGGKWNQSTGPGQDALPSRARKLIEDLAIDGRQESLT